MMIFHQPPTSLPANMRSSTAIVSTLKQLPRTRPVFAADFNAWGLEALIDPLERLIDPLERLIDPLEKLIDPLEDMISAFPLRKSVFDAPPAKARPCILVVDDDTFNFDMMESAFDSDYEVLYAAEGMTALDIAASRKPDLILLDVMMPDLDGYEVCSRLKADKRTRDIPVIFVTGLGDMSAETRGLELGAVDYITKPINATAVRARVNNQIKLKWALDKLTEVAALEQTLRNDLIEVLELKSRGQTIQ
jgi:CheY-like chemotaxis protein